MEAKLRRKTKPVIAARLIIQLLLILTFVFFPKATLIETPATSYFSGKVKQHNINKTLNLRRITISTKAKIGVKAAVVDTKHPQPVLFECEEFDYSSAENNKRNLNLTKNFKQYLSQSNLENDRLVYALIQQHGEDDSAIKLLYQFTTDYPDNAIGQLSLLNQCLYNTTNRGFCDRIDINEITPLAQENGAFWINLAMVYQQNHQPILSERALEHSLNTPVMSYYFGEIIYLFNQALLNSGEPNDPLTKISAIGYTAAISLPSLSSFSSLCRTKSEKDFEFYKLCIEVSKELATKGDSLLLTRFGEQFYLSLKLKHQDIIGAASKDIDRKLTVYSNSVVKQMSIANLIYYDNQLAEFWLNSLVKHREVDSIEMTYNEAIRLSKNPNYNPCPGHTINSD